MLWQSGRCPAWLDFCVSRFSTKDCCNGMRNRLYTETESIQTALFPPFAIHTVYLSLFELQQKDPLQISLLYMKLTNLRTGTKQTRYLLHFMWSTLNHLQRVMDCISLQDLISWAFICVHTRPSLSALSASISHLLTHAAVL